MSREYRNWTKNDPVQYYQTKYSGMSRTQLAKADSSCYNILLRRGLLDKVIPQTQIRVWKNNAQLVDFVREKYPGLSRGQLKKVDGSCYVALRTRHLLDLAIPEKRAQRDWTVEDPVRFYNKNYAGVSREQLRKIDVGCYEALRARRVLDSVIPKKRREWSSNTELLAFAKKNYSGMTRSQLEKTDLGCHRALKKRGLLDAEFPRTRHIRNWKGKSDAEVVDFARKNYKGMTRREFQKVDSGCYHVLNKRGLLDLVMKEKQERKAWGSDDELARFAKKNYSGMTREELRTADSACYATLCRRGLINVVIPPKRRTPRTWGTDGDLVKFALENYGSLTRMQLYEKDPGCYGSLQRRGLLDIVIPKKERPIDLEGMLDDIVGDEQ